MKRILFLGCLCLALQLRGQGASSTNAAAPTRPAQRFLFLIDTSSAMSRQKTDTMDTMSRMILSAVGGRIQINDFLGLWTVDDQLQTDAIPTQRWDPQQRGELANHVYRYLRDKHFNKKNAVLEKAMAAVAEEAQSSGTLNVLLFTDGSIPVKGTPFDDSINEIFAKHAAGMKKAKKPFVIVLITREGRFVAHAVSPGGGQIYIPRLPKAVETAKKTETKETAPAVTRPPGRTLTEEEFSEILLPRRSNTVASTSVPLILRGGAPQTNQAALEPFSQVATGTLAQVPAAPTVAPAETTAPPDSHCNGARSDWNDAGSYWNDASSDWNDASSDWNGAGSDWNGAGSDWNDADSDRNPASSDWNGACAGWCSASADWSGPNSDRNGASSDWNHANSDRNGASSDCDYTNSHCDGSSAEAACTRAV